MSKTTMTIEGYAAKDTDLRDVNGQQVATVTVPHTPRRKNRDTGQFEDAGPTLWVQAAFWGDEAAAVHATVSKGTLVTITGQPELNVYTKNDGTTDAQIRLKFATLGVIPKPGRTAAPAPAQEPWATPGSTVPAQADSWGAPATYGDDTPF